MIKVNTTSGNVYEVPDGIVATLMGVAPVGEIAVSVFSSEDEDAEHWLGTFGNVEAVYKDGTVFMTAQPEAPSAGTPVPGPWA